MILSNQKNVGLIPDRILIGFTKEELTRAVQGSVLVVDGSLVKRPEIALLLFTDLKLPENPEDRVDLDSALREAHNLGLAKTIMAVGLEEEDVLVFVAGGPLDISEGLTFPTVGFNLRCRDTNDDLILAFMEEGFSQDTKDYKELDPIMISKGKSPYMTIPVDPARI